MNATETPEQMVKRICEETAHARTPITTYRSADPAYAHFRVFAVNRLMTVTAKHVRKEPLPDAETKFLNIWCQQSNDGVGRLIRHFLDQLESATGRPVQIQ